MTARAIACALATCFACASNHEFGRLDRERVKIMLREVAGDVKEHYYDPRFHGVDFDAKVAEAQQEVDRSLSLDEALSWVAGVLGSLGDSHTYFLTPARIEQYEYGFRMQAIGDRC